METKVHLSNEDNTSKFLRTRLTLLYRSTLASTSPPCRAKLTQKHNLKAGQLCSRPSWVSQTSPDLILISPGWSCSRTQWAKISSKAPSRHRWFKIATSVTDCTQHVNRQQTGGEEDRYLALTSDPRAAPLGYTIFIMKLVNTRMREELHLI